MGQYSFIVGLGSFQTCNVDTDGKCKIRKIRVSGSDGGETSLEIGVSSRSESDLSLTYRIEDVSKMFEEIIKVIMENELKNYNNDESVDEDRLTEQIMADLQNYRDFTDENDSNDLHGFSDIVSLSSAETIDIGYIKEQYQDLGFLLQLEYDYLDQPV
jgi:hypothetical protein